MVTKKLDVYTQDGVNVNSGDQLSQYAKNAAIKTYSNSPFMKVNSSGYFRGPLSIEFQKLPPGWKQLYLGADGIGTKVGLHQATGTYHLAAFDLIAMVSDDAVRYGMMPLTVTNILSVDSTGSNKEKATTEQKRNFNATCMIYDGLVEASKTADIVIIGGETAETGVYTGSEIPASKALHFNMEAVVMGIVHPEKMITGENLKPGQAIIALKENGFRSNGISSVRKSLVIKFGEDWWNNPRSKNSVEQAAIPSIIYSKLIATLNGWYSKDFKKEVEIHAIAHITGGGILSKLGHDILFKKNLSAQLNNLFNPPKIMEECRKWRGMTESEAYTTWNGGQGMLLVVDNNQFIINHILMRAKEFGVDAQVCGLIHKWKNPRISIESKFGQKNKRLTYKAGE